MTQKRNPLLLTWRMSRVGWHLLSGCTQIAVFFGRSSAEQKQRRIQKWSAQLLNVCGMQVQVVGDIRAIPKDTGRFQSLSIYYMCTYTLRRCVCTLLGLLSGLDCILV